MTTLPVTALRTVTCCLCLLLAGCATTREPTPGDPFETANRGIYAANVSVDRVTLRPVARVYARHTPQWVRSMVGNFFTNMSTPFTIANQILQGKPKEAAQDTLRFTMNTTLGLAGFFDPASDAGLPRHDEDLGQTLGRWGVPPGPFIMMPLLGPAHLRDIPSAIAERFAMPLYWYSPGNARWISLAISAVDLRARLLPLDETLAKTYDPYAFIREAFNQRRLATAAAALLPQTTGRRVRPENLHCTLVFLGNVDAGQRLCVEAAATALAPLSSFTLTSDRFGYFRGPQVAWLGCSRTPPALLDPVAQLGRGCAACGFPPEQRPYEVHLTVARKLRRDPGRAPFMPIEWRVGRFALVESVSTDEGVRYQPLRFWELRSG